MLNIIMMKRTIVGLGMVGCLALVGCAGEPAVRGTITFDGKPIPKGLILLNPVNETLPNAGAAIQDGVYEIPAGKGPRVGTYRVSIHWPQPTGKKLPNPEKYDTERFIDETQEMIPAKYNRESSLTVEIRRGSNVFDFDLVSK
jgi:hypothetical protein